MLQEKPSCQTRFSRRELLHPNRWLRMWSLRWICTSKREPSRALSFCLQSSSARGAMLNHNVSCASSKNEDSVICNFLVSDSEQPLEGPPSRARQRLLGLT